MKPSSPLAAIRSSSFLHADEGMQTAFDEASKNITQPEDEELRILQKIATLEDHPGWQLIRDKFMQTIEEYRSGRKLDTFAKDYTLSDAQIGQATRNMNLVADELTVLLNSVMIAVHAVEQQKAEQKDATRRMGSRVKG